ncbi:MAG: recombinase family protein [Bilifractor sp.]
MFEYADRGYTGTDFNRPAFEQMMEDVRNEKIDCIIVKDLSRLGRDYLETSNYVEVIFPFLGVRFISVNDHFDTNEEQNGNKELEIALKKLVNDMYARDISKRVSTTREHEQVTGKFLGSNAPYGYRVDEKHPLRRLVIDPPSAEIVRQIYAMALEGKTVREISLILQKRKVCIPGQYLKTGHLYREPGDKAVKWYTGTIANILHARTLCRRSGAGEAQNPALQGRRTSFY